jgi:histidine ammonia-lyase
MAASRRVVERAARGDEPVYGVNTGFGHLASVSVPAEELRELQVNLVRSHCAGTGEPFPREVVRAVLALRANVLARGHSGARPLVARHLLRLLRADLLPVVPSQGSVGASGDLAPLAHVALAAIGEGEVLVKGRRRPAGRALREAGIEPLRLEAKEGLALINGTQVSTAQAVLALVRAEELLRAADLAAAVAVEALRATVRAYDDRVHAARPHPGQEASADNLRRLLADSQIAESHRDCGKVQDSYALRCVPQVHGAGRLAAAEARRVLSVELNSSTDNPMVFAEQNELVSGGNFHGQPVATVCDYLALALAGVGSVSERRCDRLVNPLVSGLPAFLAEGPGLESGLMMAQVSAAALVSENKGLSHPASVDSIPTSALQEDHVSMSTWAARKLDRLVDNVEGILAIEFLAGMQALEFLDPLRPARAVAAARRAYRRALPHRRGDRVLAGEIEAARALLRDGSLVRAAESAAGPLL